MQRFVLLQKKQDVRSVRRGGCRSIRRRRFRDHAGYSEQTERRIRISDHSRSCKSRDPGRRGAKRSGGCRETVQKMGIPCRVYCFDVPKLAAQWKTGLEEAGRTVRRQAFEEALAGVPVSGEKGR